MYERQLDNIKNLKDGYIKSMNRFYNFLFGTNDIKNVKIPSHYSLGKLNYAMGMLLGDSKQITERLFYSKCISTGKRVYDCDIDSICKKSNEIFDEAKGLEKSLNVKVPKFIRDQNEEIKKVYKNSRRNIEYLAELANKDFMYGVKYTLREQVIRMVGEYINVNQVFFDSKIFENRN
ncbi:MAG: hypothetical protein PHV16_05375 [Candidatus Nanoarchaeia archaeon]|nr:hypothetical protein [Candidatus Nanoarchaeia archaeon]